MADSAWELSKAGRYEEAIAEWKKALELNPEATRRTITSACFWLAPGSSKKLFRISRRRLTINPEYPAAHSNLGVALAGIGKLDEASAEFGKALEMDPDSAEAHNNLGRVLVIKGEFDQGIAHFRKALETTPDSASVRNNLGLALANSGRESGPEGQVRRSHPAVPERSRSDAGFR